MRQIEQQMVNAVNGRYNFKSGNTRVEIFNDKVSVLLHGNYIFRIVDGVSYFTLAGWNTNTTRSRLHALGVAVNQKNFAPVYNGVEIDADRWYNV